MGIPVKKNLVTVMGDTLAFSFEVGGVDLLDTAFFSCKIDPDYQEYLFQKSLNDGITYRGNGQYSVRLAPSETKNFEVGSYYYDLEIGVNNDIYTLMIGRLKVEQDITKH